MPFSIMPPVPETSLVQQPLVPNEQQDPLEQSQQQLDPQEQSQEINQQQQPSVVPPQYAEEKKAILDFEQVFYIEKAQWHDQWATVLFLICFGAFVAVSIWSIFGFHSARFDQIRGIMGGDTSSMVLDTNAIVLFISVLGLAFLLSLLYFTIIRAFTKQTILFTACFNIVFGYGLGFYYSMKKQSHAPTSVTFFVLTSIFMICFLSWRSRIPFTVLMLQTVMDVSKQHGHVFVVSTIGGLTATAFGAWFSVTFVAVYVTFHPDGDTCHHKIGGQCSTGRLIWLLVFITFAAYWISEVIKNVMHVTISGVYGSWYFCSKTAGFPRKTTRGAFKRAMTTSFGSISLGSLLVAIVHVFRQACSLAQLNASADGNWVGQIFFTILGCFITFLERFLLWINQYAFSYIALYGKSFPRAAKATWRMMQDRGVTAVVNDCIIDFVLNMGVFFVAFFCSLLASLYLTYTKPSYNVDPRFAPVVMAYAFLIGLQICNVFMAPIRSGVATVFVGMAFNPGVLAKDFPELWENMVLVYPPILEIVANPV